MSIFSGLVRMFTGGHRDGMTVLEGGIAPYPHCDSMVLHAPGRCEYCDQYPRLQGYRLSRRINFTGETDPAKEPCPSLRLRDLETIERWPGNRAKPRG